MEVSASHHAEAQTGLAMHRVYVAWDTKEAQRFLGVLRGRGIQGRIIEDEDVHERGGIHDAEVSPEVWITDDSKLAEALALASQFEAERNAAGSSRPPPSSSDQAH